MAKLIYTSLISLDGYIEDASGNFDWAAPDQEVHAFVNDLERPIGTYLYGRRLYEVMTSWETEDFSAEPPVLQDYADLWRRADKVIYSRTLESVSTQRTRIEREFDPEAVRQLKASVDLDLAIGGADLAARAIEAGLVDEFRLIIAPVIVGGGKRMLPDNVHIPLERLEKRGFSNGMIYLRYQLAP